jgi:hypothetical protein
MDPATLPSVYFMFNELWIEVSGADYLMDVSSNRDRSLCQLAFYKNPLAFNVFGTPLFMGYYTTHDPVNNKISFVPTKNSPKTRLQIGTLATNQFDAPLTLEVSIWVYVITGVCVVGIAVLYYFVLIPELNKVITSKILVVLVATVITGGLAAAYVWGILPAVKKAFGAQTEVDQVDPSTIPLVQASKN